MEGDGMRLDAADQTLLLMALEALDEKGTYDPATIEALYVRIEKEAG